MCARCAALSRLIAPPVIVQADAVEPPLEPVAEEGGAEEPEPPPAEEPTAIWNRLSEEAKNSNPNYNLEEHMVYSDDSGEDDASMTHPIRRDRCASAPA